MVGQPSYKMENTTYNERLKSALPQVLQSYAGKTPEQRKMQSDKQFSQWSKIKFGKNKKSETKESTKAIDAGLK